MTKAPRFTAKPPALSLAQAFGDVVRELRREQGLSQEKLAFAAGVDRNFVSILELGQQVPSLSSAFKIAVGLGMKPSDLVAKVECRFSLPLPLL